MRTRGRTRGGIPRWGWLLSGMGLLIALAVAVAGITLAARDEGGGELFLQPASSLGPDPFSTYAATAWPSAPAPSDSGDMAAPSRSPAPVASPTGPAPTATRTAIALDARRQAEVGGLARCIGQLTLKDLSSGQQTGPIRQGGQVVQEPAADSAGWVSPLIVLGVVGALIGVSGQVLLWREHRRGRAAVRARLSAVAVSTRAGGGGLRGLRPRRPSPGRTRGRHRRP
ncbi:hypothetical protein AB0953_15680 [Streptomyces sp. NPDC046866]|uniref:hypothetical protein n=1 Tax=Streptomyces sp. NPDC046866 TaxID=3154921 RepID=UPI0034518CAB